MPKKPDPDIFADVENWLNGKPVPAYKTILRRWGPEFERWGVEKMLIRRRHRPRSVTKAALDRTVRSFMARDRYIKDYGFSIPCKELLDELARHDRVVEIGAGTGFMTALMRHRGIDVMGSDPGAYWPKGSPRWDKQQVKRTGAVMARLNPDATIFCSWPCYQKNWFHNALKAMKKGQHIVAILDWGCCADEAGRDYLTEHFEEEKKIEIPVFEHMRDFAVVARKL